MYMYVLSSELTCLLLFLSPSLFNYHRIDRKLTPGIRCTVEIEPSSYTKVGSIRGKVVSPSLPRERNGTYWGYQTRIANSIWDAIDNCPFAKGSKYDLKIGTSERGDISIEGANSSSGQKVFTVPRYEHVIIVFGGVAGIEECCRRQDREFGAWPFGALAVEYRAHDPR